MFYPLFFKPVYKNIIWGGTNFEKLLGRAVEPAGSLIAESWDVCAHKNGMSVVENGPFAGKTLGQLADEYGEQLVGSKAMLQDRFPILIKLIDANDRLSVQVHPGNDYALRMHGDYGKTEMWYVIDAKPGAKIIYGTCPNTTSEAFEAALKDGSVEKYLNFVDVKKGDSIFIPSGTLHAILDGLVIAEIQQNSDTTYRVFDWNRVDSNNVPRELHVKNALDVINFEFDGKLKTDSTNLHDGYSTTELVRCEFFNVDKLCVTSSYTDNTDTKSFYAYTVVGVGDSADSDSNGDGDNNSDGHGDDKPVLIHDNTKYSLKLGTSFLLPAATGSYTITGQVELLKTWL